MRFFAILCLIGTAMCSRLGICPAVEELEPCTCQYYSTIMIYIECIDFSLDLNITLDVLEQSFKSLQGQSRAEMILYGTNLGKVPSNFFKGIGIEKLIIRKSPLESLGDGNDPILSVLENSLKELRIQNSFNEDADLSNLKFEHLHKMKMLFLPENNFKEVSNTWFEMGPASLETLDLDRNSIQKISDRAFADLTNIKTISLNQNRIESIKRSMFPKPAKILQSVSLGENIIDTLPEDLFLEMPALRSFSIQKNRITTLQQSTWGRVWEQLTIVDLTDNPLMCDSSLEWTFNSRRPYLLRGSCDSPNDVQGKHLEKFISDRG